MEAVRKQKLKFYILKQFFELLLEAFFSLQN